MASLKSLIPSNLLTTMVEETFRKALVFGNVVNTDFEGVIRNAGDSVRIPVIGDVTIADHTVNDTLTYEGLDAADMVLKVDQQKRFSFKIDIVDEAQSNINILAKYMDKAAYQLADTADQYIAARHADAGVTTNLGTTGTPLTITAAATTGSNIGVHELFSRISLGLDQANVSTNGRYAVVPPWLSAKLVLAGVIELSTVDQGAYVNGQVGRAFGFDIRMSNNVVNGSTTGSKVMAGTSDAISFAGQITDLETLKLETSYGMGGRGLYVYGCKTVQADALAVATVSAASG